jgi:cytochrome P450 PksS
MTSTAERGSDIVTDLSEEVMFSDPFARYAELRRMAPVSRVRSKQLVRSGGFMLTRYNDVMMLHGDTRFSSDTMQQTDSWLMNHLPRTFRLLADSMVYKDDPDHARLRRLVNKAFTPRIVQQMSADIERIVDELLAKLAQRDVVDLVADFAVPLPLSVISNMLGVTEDDRDEFHSLMARFVTSVGSGSMTSFVAAVPNARKLLKMIERMAEERRINPDAGLITGLISASEDGDKLSSDEIDAMIFLLMLAGQDTTANLIGSAALTLIEHPEQAARLRTDDAIAPAAVEELLRFTTPVPCGAVRVTLEDVEVGGTTLPKGSKVLGMIISANRDEAIFDQPDVLDLGRDPNRHITFAFGKHFCLGNQLARMEGQIAIRSLVGRFPDMALAVPRDRLRYKPIQSLRGLKNLPLRLH